MQEFARDFSYADALSVSPDPHRFRDRRTLREVSRVSPDRGTGSPRWATSGNGDTKKVTPAQTARVPLEAVPARRSVNWYAIAATLALVITGAQLFLIRSQSHEEQVAALDSVTSPTDSIMTMLSRKDSMIAAMTVPT